MAAVRWFLILSMTLVSACSGAEESLRLGDCFSQAPLYGSPVGTHVGIHGPGFLILEGAGASPIFTRSGVLRLDEDGVLLQRSGHAVLGWADPSGAADTLLSALRPVPFRLPPRATQRLELTLNLNAGFEELVHRRFELDDPAGTSNFSNSVVIYDRLGAATTLTIFYTRTGPGDWGWSALAPPSSGSDEVELIGQGELRLDTEGQLRASTGAIVHRGQSVAVDFTGTTGWVEPFSVYALDQDGFRAGDLDGVGVDPDGVVVATYTNGERVHVGRIALATFEHPCGLQPMFVDSELYLAPSQVGTIEVAPPGDDVPGVIAGGALEWPYSLMLGPGS